MDQGDDEPGVIQHGFAGGAIDAKSDAAFKGVDQRTRFAAGGTAEFS